MKSARQPGHDGVFRSLFEQAADAIFLVNGDDRLLDANGRACEMLGFTREDLLLMLFADLLALPERSRLDAATKEIKAGKPHRAEWDFWRKDGSTLPVEATFSRLDDHTYTAIVRDFTAHRQTESALRESEVRFRAFMQNSPLLAWVVAADGTHLYANENYCRFLRRTPNQVIGQHMEGLFGPEYAAEFMAVNRSVIDGGVPVEVVERAVKPDGTVGQFLAYKFPLPRPDGTIDVGGIAIDITERKQAEAALRESEETIRQMTQSIAPTTGEDFFRALVVRLGRACQVKFAFVGVIDRENSELVHSIAVSIDGQLADNVSYTLPGTPCESVVGQKFCYHPSGVQQLFPGDLMLLEMGLESYMGMPLVSSQGKTMGLMALLHDRTMAQPKQAEAIFRVVAGRATAELERLQAETERDRLFNSALDLFCVLGRDGFFKQLNPSWETVLGWTAEEMKARPWIEFIHPDDRVASLGAKATLEKNQMVTDFENRYQHRDGTYRWLQWKAPVPEGDNIFGVARDVTERKRAEVALRDSEARFRQLIDHAPEAMVILDTTTGRFIQVNPAAERLFKLPAEELYKVGPLEMSPARQPDGRPSTEKGSEFIARALAGATPVFEWTHRDSEGRDVPCEVRLLRMEIGGLAVVRGSVTDITERKRAEAALRASEERFRAIFDQTFQFVGLMSTDGILLEANRSALQFAGIREQEVIGKPFWDTPWWSHSTALQHQLREAIRAAAAGQFVRMEVSHPAADGSLHFVDFSLKPVRDEAGKVTLLIPEGRDITERKRAEALVAAQYRVLESISSGVPLEKTLETLMHLLEAQMPGSLCSVLLLDADGMHLRHGAAPSLPADFNAAIDGIRIGPEGGSCGTAAYLAKTVVVEDIVTDPLWVNFRALALAHGLRACWSTPIFDEKQRVLGTFAIYMRQPMRPTEEHSRLAEVAKQTASIAITRHRVEAELRHSEAQLRQSQKMEAIGQLAGGVAHDFNNILSAIMGETELADMLPDLPKEAHAGLQQIHKSAERAANLTRQLLLFSRKQVMQPRVMDLNEIVTGLIKMLQRIIGEDVRLHLILNPEPLVTHADAGMMEQVLMNLVVNARDAMPEGGKLVIETFERSWTDAEAAVIPGASAGRYACLRVTDTGGGIAPENLPRIFEPFFTTKGPGKGTGLGLATVFGIVKQHGGWLSVESEVGKGTTLHVCLPTTNVVPSPDKSTPPAPPPRGSETILLVEDDSAVRSLTRIVLEKSGYRVLEAAHGFQALEIWKQHKDSIQLLFTDLVMPEGVSGGDLATRLRSSHPDLAVVFTSGYSAEIAGRELCLLKRQRFIQKPARPHELLEAVRACLDGSHAG